MIPRRLRGVTRRNPGCVWSFRWRGIQGKYSELAEIQILCKWKEPDHDSHGPTRLHYAAFLNLLSVIYQLTPPQLGHFCSPPPSIASLFHCLRKCTAWFQWRSQFNIPLTRTPRMGAQSSPLLVQISALSPVILGKARGTVYRQDTHPKSSNCESLDLAFSNLPVR